MSRTTIRVLLVEDNDVYRSSIELLLGLQPDLEIVGSVSSGTEAAGSAVACGADVVVMDYRLPGLDGAAATRAVTESSRAAVVCLTAEATQAEREAVLRAGASALVEKGGAIEVLAAAIRSAAHAGSVPGGD
ncbi:MAG: response regulator transcription factor [Actinobacteria bacterium]|nr:response regulator transcription factor [Actinomycetota bacterium]